MNRFALSGEAQLRQGAETELYWSSIFLKYAADLKVGRFLPTKIEPQLYWQPKAIAMRWTTTLGSLAGYPAQVA